ncbi:MAG: Ig-like domain-containing protein [Firmicutes bacterium]|nr:Ig-like domain-containing protein [Bacillota bacterium]
MPEVQNHYMNRMLSSSILTLSCLACSLALIAMPGAVGYAAGSQPGSGPPRVVAVYPSDGMTDVPVDTGIHIIFSKPMDREKAINAFSMSPSPTLVFPGSWRMWNDDTVLVVMPAKALQYDTRYVVTIGAGAAGRDGSELGSEYSWSFRTAKRPALPSELPKNGGFDAGNLSGWSFSYEGGPGEPPSSWRVVKDGERTHVLEISRDLTFDMGRASVEQKLDVDVPVSGLVFVSLDLKLGDYTNKVYTERHAYPAKLIVKYLGQDGKEHEFTRSYYYHPPVDGGLDSYAEFVELNRWTSRSYNLSTLIPRPVRIVKIILECAGWGWSTSFDNVRIAW